MKKLLIHIALILIISSCLAFAQVDSLNVLFIGNSHTYFNDMPQLFTDLAESGGKVVYKDQSTPGGYTLEGHTSNSNTLHKIALGIWDYVVLQENSQYPVINYIRYNSMYPSARTLDSLIAYYSGNTAFFMTWGWRNGGVAEVDGHQSPYFIDYFHMQDSMTSAYTEISDELRALLVPAGEAWRTALLRDTSLVLWAPDNYHPGLNGSYLAACVFYAKLFEESPVGLTFTGGLTIDEALFLQEAAEDMMTDLPEPIVSLPSHLSLSQNYPNPFNASTNIEFSLSVESDISMIVYDILGREITVLADGSYSCGVHSIFWDGTDDSGESVSSGVYFYYLKTDSYSVGNRMILIK